MNMHSAQTLQAGATGFLSVLGSVGILWIQRRADAPKPLRLLGLRNLPRLLVSSSARRILWTNSLIITLILLFLPFVSFGQLKVDLKFKHTSVLKHEPLLAFVSIYNDSDIPFVLDEDAEGNNTHLEFIIEKKTA